MTGVSDLPTRTIEGRVLPVGKGVSRVIPLAFRRCLDCLLEERNGKGQRVGTTGTGCCRYRYCGRCGRVSGPGKGAARCLLADMGGRALEGHGTRLVALHPAHFLPCPCQRMVSAWASPRPAMSGCVPMPWCRTCSRSYPRAILPASTSLGASTSARCGSTVSRSSTGTGSGAVTRWTSKACASSFCENAPKPGLAQDLGPTAP